MRAISWCAAILMAAGFTVQAQTTCSTVIVNGQAVLVGPNKYVCIQSPGDVGGSYCLRASSNDAQRDSVHIRKIASYDKLINNGPVKLDSIYSNPVPASCAVTGAPAPIRMDDQVFITQAPSGKGLEFRLVRAGAPTFFPQPVPLTAFDGFSMMANYGGFDYFVMLADENLSHPHLPNQTPLEKYYHIEAFPDQTNGLTAQCAMDRPNMSLPVVLPNGSVSSVPFNLAVWDGNTTSCDPVVHENTTGGGGEHPPGRVTNDRKALFEKKAAKPNEH